MPAPLGYDWPGFGIDGGYGKKPQFFKPVTGEVEQFVADVHEDPVIHLEDPALFIAQRRPFKARTPSRCITNRNPKTHSYELNLRPSPLVGQGLNIIQGGNMNKFSRPVIILSLSALLFACAEKKPPANLDVKRTDTMQTVAMVEGIDLKERMVTLRSLEGRTFKVHVGEEAVNLPQVRQGDRVEISYSETLEVRMAEPGEVRNDAEKYLAKAKPGEKPGALTVNETNVTATIMAMDTTNATATLKLADGSVADVKVENPENLKKVKVGDTIAIKHLEVMKIQVKGAGK